MKRVTMLTAVPANLAAELCAKKRIEDYNTLPQLNSTVLELVREYMVERVGYSNLPMACLSQAKNGEGKVITGDDILTYLPVNSKNSVIFQIEMPEDMILSINFNELLEISSTADTMTSPPSEIELEILKDSLEDKLRLGTGKEISDPISFIPFLDLDKCRFYAKFNDNFETEELDLPGIEKMSLSELTSFVN